MKGISLNRNQIKYLVIVAMLIDHIAWSPGCRLFLSSSYPSSQVSPG